MLFPAITYDSTEAKADIPRLPTHLHLVVIFHVSLSYMPMNLNKMLKLY